ncbi:AIM24 family protein [Patulibacter minatonensis]|uniref:AIM24 family protein n=1 Tax=Patulibacter minatonensis TaxID=298163 RepID=UPI000685CBAA
MTTAAADAGGQSSGTGADFLTRSLVRTSSAPGMTVENQHCVRATVDGALMARQGAMVAYRGDLTIATKGQGVKKLLKRAVTGEGLPLMEVAGRGEIWFAELAKHVAVLPVSADAGLAVAGRCVLAFDAGVTYEITRVKGAGMAGGGLFASTFGGDGSVAITADGQPMVIPVTPDAPLSVDTHAIVGWSAGLTTSITRSESAKSFLKGGSGEMFQLRLAGDGVAIVQPSEGPILPKKDGAGDVIEELLG